MWESAIDDDADFHIGKFRKTINIDKIFHGYLSSPFNIDNTVM